MSSEPILVIKDNDSTIGIRARVGDEFSEHEIQLNVLLAYYWDNDLPVIENVALPLVYTNQSRTFRLKAAELDQNALADAQADIGAGKLRVRAAEVYAPVFGSDIRDVQPFQFVRDRPLQPEQAGHTHFVVHMFDSLL